MNKQKWLIFLAMLMLLGGTAWFLGRLKNFQHLGLPGVKTRTIAEGKKLEVALPELVLEYTSEPIEVPQVALDMLPKDTVLTSISAPTKQGIPELLRTVLKLVQTERAQLQPLSRIPCPTCRSK